METTYKTYEEARNAGSEWVRKSNRWEKFEYLKKACPPDFINQSSGLMFEMVRSMGEPQFDELFNSLRRHKIVKTPQEIEFESNKG